MKYTIDSPVGKLDIHSNPDDRSITPSLKSGVYEPDIQNLLYHYIEPEYITFDIGANVGQHTILMAKLSKECHAFEASKSNVDYIRESIASNEINSVTVYNTFLDNKVGSIKYCERKDGHGWNMGILEGCNFDMKEEDLIDVPTFVLKDLVSVQPDLIKIDIEGSELGVVKSSQEIFANCKVVVCEFNNHTAKYHNTTSKELVQEFYNLGYSEFVFYQPGIRKYKSIPISSLYDQIDGILMITGALLK